MSQTIVHILLPNFPEVWVTSGTSEFTIKGSSVLKNVFLSGLNGHLNACRERAVNNTRISCCGLSLVIIHIIVQSESPTRQKVEIDISLKWCLNAVLGKLLIFGAVFLPTLTTLSFRWFFLLSKRQNFLHTYIIWFCLFASRQRAAWALV